MTEKLKGFKLEKGLDDRLGYLIFHSIFTININRQIQEKLYINLYVSLMLKLNVQNPELQTIMNLEFLFEVLNKGEYRKYVSTTLNGLYDKELISEGFLLNWQEDKLDGLVNHFLYEAGRNEVFKIHSKDFIKYLME